MDKLRYETLIGIALLCISVYSVLWVCSMVYAASDIGIMERKDLKQWSMVLVFLSVNTLFVGSVGGYLIGKYLHVPGREKEPVKQYDSRMKQDRKPQGTKMGDDNCNA